MSSWLIMISSYSIRIAISLAILVIFFHFCQSRLDVVISCLFCSFYFYTSLVSTETCLLLYFPIMLLTVATNILPHPPIRWTKCIHRVHIPDIHVYLVHHIWRCVWCIVFLLHLHILPCLNICVSHYFKFHLIFLYQTIKFWNILLHRPLSWCIKFSAVEILEGLFGRGF